MVTGGPDNPVATITLTGAHALMPGNYVQIFNAGDPAYASALNGAVTRVLAIPTSTQFTVSASYGGQTMANGDYSAGFGGQPWLVDSMYQVTDASWLQWLNVYMQGNFTVVANYAQGGTRSSVGVLLLSKIRSGPRAEYAFIQYCTNDVNSGTPDPSGCLANIKEIIAGVEELGMIPVLCTPPAIGDPAAQPSNPGSLAKNAALQVIVQGEHQIAQADTRVILLDTYAQTVVSGDAAGGYLPQYAPVDGLHPSSYGEVMLSQAVSTYLRRLLPITDLLPTSVTDDASINPAASNIIQNGLMAGTDGRVSSDPNNLVSGNAPTGWSFTASGGTPTNPLSLTVSGNNSHSGTPGYTLDVGVTMAPSGALFQFGTNASGGSSFDPRITPGNWYRCGFQLGAVTALSNFNVYGQVLLKFGGDNTPSVYFMSPESRFDNGMPLSAADTVQLLSQPFFVPSPPVGGAYLFINGAFSGPVTGQKFSLGRVFCKIVSDPYA